MASNQGRRFTNGVDGEATVIGQGIHIQGEITGSASIEVWGSLEGKAGTEGVLWVRDGGSVDGEIAAAKVVVEGKVHGKIHARDKAELRSTCRVEGDLTAKTVAIAEGAYFEGQIHMQGGSGGQATSFQEKRSPQASG